ncbi:leucine-rich repeat domain-containing protein, partial [Thermodesulfovibrionales bacterium]|nr:leucine-rich repeat domain-containing protein [Thermodesulfovibrionales bacterium]
MIFLSTARFGGGGAENHFLGKVPMSLDGVMSRTETVEVTIPQVAAGNWYIAVFTDAAMLIEETNEMNNIDSDPISLTAPPGDEEIIVVFLDPNLEAAIREAIGKPTGDIYRSDLERLTNLPASNRGISDLTGLEYAVNLTLLGLSNNQITDISPLSDLANLTWLDLRNNRISDISALSKLTDLRVLFLDYNQISDISPLSGLNRLGDEKWPLWEREGVRICLGLANNQITDISPLVQNEGLSQTDGIDLRGNLLSQKSHTTYLPQLKARGAVLLYDAPAVEPPIDEPVVGIAEVELFVIPDEVKVSFSVGNMMMFEPRAEFEIGELVGLSLHGEWLRGGDHPRLAEDTTFVISNEMGQIVWSRAAGPIGGGWSRGPGGGWGIGVGWGQVDNEGNPVAPGIYKAGVIFTDPAFDFPEDFSGVIPLRIIDIRTPPPQGWSHDIRLTHHGTAVAKPSVTVDLNNNVHIVWTDRRDGDEHWSLYYTKLDNRGNVLVDDKRIATFGWGHTDGSRQIAADSQGNLHIVWRGFEGFRTRTILYTKLDNTGNTLTPVRVVSRHDTHLHQPSIVVDFNDNLHVSVNEWLGTRYLKLDNTGRVLIERRSIGEISGWWAGEPSIAVDSQDNVYLTWFGGGPGARGIHIAKLDSDGNLLIDSTKVSLATTDSATPKIAIDSSNNIHLVWQGPDANGIWQLYYRKLDSAGSVLVDTKVITNRVTEGGWIEDLSISIDSNDNLHIVWPDNRDSNFGMWPGNLEIYYMKLDNNGNLLIADTRLTSYGGASQSPSIAVDLNNEVHVVWLDNRYGFSDIYYKYFRPEQDRLPPAAVTISSPSATLNVGDTQRFIATVHPRGADQRVTWSVGDPRIGTITAGGLFTALKAGTTTVTATSVADQTMTGTVTVVVNAQVVPVAFPDPNLEAAIREAIEKPTGDIYRSDLEGLTTLRASGRGISDLTGLEYAVNLTWLGLGGNQITDISPLSNLTNLTWLELGGNQITNISPLSNLTGLTRLWLAENQISDIGPLVANYGLSEGDEINLRGNPLSEESLKTYIPELEARGVVVLYDVPGVVPKPDPELPRIIGSVDTPNHAEGVFISGNHAYVADALSGLQIIDISNPSSPFIIGSVDTPSSAQDVYISGNHAFVADFGSGLQIIDISNPSSPVIVGSVDTPGGALGVFISGNYAFVADHWDGGLQIIDISNPSSPFIVGSVDTPGLAEGVFISGDHAFVADWDGGLQIIDVFNPRAPFIVGSVDTPGPAHDVFISGNHAFVADEGTGLEIIDISNPASPYIVGSVDTPERAMGVFISGNHAFVANERTGLEIIDISNPSSPFMVWSVNTPGWALGVFISGNHAFIADGLSGLQIIDISAIVGEPVDPEPVPEPISAVIDNYNVFPRNVIVDG